jgi:TRAP-type C4-dicarboxylate transport system permease small subunit
MTAKQRYAQLMEWIYIACVVLSGTALVAITLIIPLGVFMRYAMNNPLSWPEPAAVIMMVMFSFWAARRFIAPTSTSPWKRCSMR